MKKITFFLLLFLILTTTACSGSEPTQPTSQPANPPANPPAAPPPPTAVPPTAETNTTETTTATCEAGESGQSPLHNHQVYLATSPDGAQFEGDGELILEHASVPDGVIGPDGRLWVYFVNGEPGKHGIFAARQSDDGAWEVVDCVKLDGRFEGNAVDPDITRLADGRYRLVYFLGHFVGGPPPDPNQPHPIYSASSDDGIHFTIEQQLIAVEGVTDPSLVQLPDGRWLLAMVRAQEQEILLAASDDGDTFELTGVTINMPGIPELAALPDGRIRLYLSQSLISSDGGQTWTVEEGSFVPGGGADPSLAALPEGGYAFFYKGFSGQPGNPPPGQPGQPGNPPSDQSQPPTPMSTSDFTPCSGYGEPLDGDENQLGPWASRLMIAFSSDGLNFTHTGQILADQADVPDVLVMPDGEIRVYFVTLCPETVRNQIVVAVSRDAVDWTYHKTSITGMEGVQPVAVDPTVEFTPDGRIRLYFTSVATSPDAMPQSYSAISDDGYTFEMESGVRFGVEGSRVLDPTALQIGDTWHYFGGGQPGINYHATSPDGLNFTRQDDLKINDFLFANGIAVEGGYRYYGFIQQPRSAASAIYSVFTTDGQNWVLEDGVRLALDESNPLEKIGVKDPGVARLPDGRYLMVYSTLIPEYPYDEP